MGRKYEKTQKKNPHSLTIDQHVWPAASIARFANISGVVDVLDKLQQSRRTAAPNDVRIPRIVNADSTRW